MAIFRCNKCGHIREVDNEYIGKSVKCPECEKITPIYDTVNFLKAVIDKYMAQTMELQTFKKEAAKDYIEHKDEENLLFKGIDIHKTDVLAHTNNLEPISGWFEKHKIEVKFNRNATDTRGFYDEIALRLGNDFEILSLISNQIKYSQNKGYTNAKIELSKKNSQEIQKLTSFCKELYDYSFVTKYVYQKKDKVIWLTLQTAPKIREFFNGIWMEWFALIKLLQLFRKEKIAPACARALDISFNNGKSNELDIFVLTEKSYPVCIECKTGEFRQDIDKYLTLRKQLNIGKDQFVVCVFGLNNEQAKGLTSMYDLTFVNELSLIEHVHSVIKGH